MNLLVTGGCGFIGSNFINYWAKKHKDDFIANIDKLTYASSLSNIDMFVCDASNYMFCNDDICDTEAMGRFVSTFKIDTIVNFAAESHVDRSIDASNEFVKSNFMGVHSLLMACMEKGIKKFIQISTDEVYGDLPLNTEESFKENYPLKPNNPYSATKASAELLIRSWIKTYDFPAVITRCCNNYGPNQFPEKFFPVMINKALNNEQLPIYGDGENVREWIYVDDHCSAIEAVIMDGLIGESYNVGTGHEISNIKMARTILDILGKPETLLSFVDDRLGHDRRYSVCSEKINTELGWIPSFPFEVGLDKTIEYYRLKTK